jgi:hypothetical protein
MLDNLVSREPSSRVPISCRAIEPDYSGTGTDPTVEKVDNGILFLVLAIVSAVLIIFLLGIPIYIIVWVINILDAHKTAKRINEGLDTED